jgi:sugar-specific transcriptional regulator TrmB
MEGFDMSINERLVNHLRQFGLTVYEGRAYSILVSRGVLKAKEIAEDARIPYSKIYFVLNDLESKGWVEIQRGKPSLYKPVPPRDAIESSKERILQRLKDAEVEALNLLERLYTGQEEVRKVELWSIRGTGNVLRRIERMLAQAEREVWMAFTLNHQNIVKLLGKRLVEIVRILEMKGVDVKMLVIAKKVEIVTEFLSELVASIELKWKQDAELLGGIGLIVVDDKQALFNFGGRDEFSATWSDEKGFVYMLKEVIKNIWFQAKPCLNPANY